MQDIRHALFLVAILRSPPGHSADLSYLDVAREVAQWIESSAINTSKGLEWPADPRDPTSANPTLYAGSPGPVLFLLEAYRYIGDQRYLAQARRGADALAAASQTDDPPGFYVGLAGTGFTLGQAYLVTHESKYRRAALQCVGWLKEQAKAKGHGIEWDQGNDIIGGAAGTGLFLLWAAQQLKAPGARELAAQSGARLLETAERLDEDRVRWPRGIGTSPEMPNFAHGTAGIAYFLATLYQETKQKPFLEAAIAGANYLTSIADTRGEGCLVYHDGAHKDLFYLGWCHGPAGDARLFYRLYEITRNSLWMDWVKKAATAMIAHGAPAKVVSPGEWNNISLCCGTTAQAAFLLDMYTLP